MQLMGRELLGDVELRRGDVVLLGDVVLSDLSVSDMSFQRDLMRERPPALPLRPSHFEFECSIAASPYETRLLQWELAHPGVIPPLPIFPVDRLAWVRHQDGDVSWGSSRPPVWEDPKTKAPP